MTLVMIHVMILVIFKHQNAPNHESVQLGNSEAVVGGFSSPDGVWTRMTSLVILVVVPAQLMEALYSSGGGN